MINARQLQRRPVNGEGVDAVRLEVRVIQVEKITQGFAEFEFVEPSDDGFPAGAFLRGVGFLERGSESGDDFSALSPGGLCLFLRRHFAEVELIQNSLPGYSWQVGVIILQKVEAIVAFLFFGAVAFDAVFLQEGARVFKEGSASPKASRLVRNQARSNRFIFSLG